MTNVINLKPAHQLARERSIARHPSNQGANMTDTHGGFKSIGSSEAILNVLKSTPGRKWSNKELARETGFSDTQVQTGLLHLRRKGLPISGSDGTYAWDENWTPTKIQLQRMVSLYELMLSNAVKSGDSVPVFRGSYQRVLTPRAKQYFRVRGAFSGNALSTTYRHLVKSGSIEIRGGRAFEKFLIKHPLDIYENPHRIRRYDKGVRAPEVEVESNEPLGSDMTVAEFREAVEAKTVDAWGWDAGWGPVEWNAPVETETPKTRSPRVAALVDRWHNLTESERGFHSVIGTSLNGHTLVRDREGQVYELRPV